MAESGNAHDWKSPFSFPKEKVLYPKKKGVEIVCPQGLMGSGLSFLWKRKETPGKEKKTEVFSPPKNPIPGVSVRKFQELQRC